MGLRNGVKEGGEIPLQLFTQLYIRALVIITRV